AHEVSGLTHHWLNHVGRALSPAKIVVRTKLRPPRPCTSLRTHEGPHQASGPSFILPAATGSPKTPPEKSGAITVELPISIRGPRPSSPAGRRRPRLCARSSWRHQTLACGCRSSPHPVVSIPTMADNAPIMVIVPAKGGGWFAAAKRQEIAVRRSHSCCMELPGANGGH